MLKYHLHRTRQWYRDVHDLAIPPLQTKNRTELKGMFEKIKRKRNLKPQGKVALIWIFKVINKLTKN